MPPWRGHLEDIPALVDHFIRKYNCMFRKTVTGADPEVIRRFQTMRWGGNVYADFNRSLEEKTRATQRKYYLHHLERNHFNIRQTALDLEMERTCLTAIMKRLKIQKPEKNKLPAPQGAGSLIRKEEGH